MKTLTKYFGLAVGP